MIYTEDKTIIIPYLIRLLKTGKYSSTQIVIDFYKRPESRLYPKTFNDSKIREVVNYIRKEGIESILASRTGYFISYDVIEIYDYYTCLNDRIERMKEAADGIKKTMMYINKQNKNAHKKFKGFNEI